MRHNFVNDIGDYAKYALLRALCSGGSASIRLGVIWYLTSHAESNGDGRKRPHLSRDGWAALDPELLAEMRRLERGIHSLNELRLRLIEDSDVLPESTVYFSEPLPHTRATPKARLGERASWFARAQQKVAGCNLIFLDPDNGLEVPSVPLSSPFAGKYAAVSEISALLATGASVILYQHGDRTTWQEQRERICTKLTAAIDLDLHIQTLRFGAYGVRAFFCVSTDLDMARSTKMALDTLRLRTASWDKAHYLLIE